MAKIIEYSDVQDEIETIKIGIGLTVPSNKLARYAEQIGVIDKFSLDVTIGVNRKIKKGEQPTEKQMKVVNGVVEIIKTIEGDCYFVMSNNRKDGLTTYLLDLIAKLEGCYDKYSTYERYNDYVGKTFEKSKLPTNLTELRKCFEIASKTRKVKGVEKTYYTIVRNKYYRKMILLKLLKHKYFAYLDEENNNILVREYTENDAKSDRYLINSVNIEVNYNHFEIYTICEFIKVANYLQCLMYAVEHSKITE